MKRGKKLLILLLVLAVLGGVTALLSNLNWEKETVADTSITIVSVDTETVTALSWTYGEETPAFWKVNGAWEYTGDSAYPVDTTKLDLILLSVAEVVSTKTIEDVSDLADYGLDQPACAITIATDVETTLLIGNETGMGGQRYASIGDGNVYLIDEGLVDDFAYGLDDLMVLETIPDLSSAARVSIQTQTETLTLEKLEESGLAYSSQYVWFVENGGGYTALDTELVETLVSSISALSWTACADYNAQDLAQYGLDTPDVTVTVDYTGSQEVELEQTDTNGDPIVISEEVPAAFTLALGTGEDGGAYARIDGSNMVYSVDATVVDTLCYTTQEELLPDDVLRMDWDTVTSMDITLDGQTHTITREVVVSTDDAGNTTTETVWQLDGAEVDGGSIESALDALAGTGYASGVAPTRSAEITFTFHRNTASFPTVELVLYQYDSASCLATLDGASTLFVDRSAVVDLTETVNTLLLG